VLGCWAKLQMLSTVLVRASEHQAFWFSRSRDQNPSPYSGYTRNGHVVHTLTPKKKLNISGTVALRPAHLHTTQYLLRCRLPLPYGTRHTAVPSHPKETCCYHPTTYSCTTSSYLLVLYSH
jgi:hypothetical protein